MSSQALPVEQSSSWLAMNWGCCASRRDSIGDEERLAMRPKEIDMQICYEQPQLVPQPKAESLHTRPVTGHSMGQHVSQWVSNSRDYATRASSRVSLNTISKPRKSFAKSRPIIGRPTDFRRFDGLDGIQSMVDDAPLPVRRRRSFTPIELSIYGSDGRLSPLPDFAEEEWSKLELQKPTQAVVRDRDSIISTHSTSSFLIQRKPVGSGSKRSSLNSMNGSRPVSGSFSTMALVQEESATVSRSETPSAERPISALRRSSTQGATSARLLARLPSPSRPRSNTAPTRPGSLRRAKTDVDEAIRELNTIVEERRADAFRSSSPFVMNRPPPSPSHHVPAIAPALRMHVRSETLSDIGSAFSTPLANKPLPTTPEATSTFLRPTNRLNIPAIRNMPSGPLNSNPITPPTTHAPTPTTPIHRLGAWIKRSMPTTPSTPAFFKSAPTTPKSSRSISTPFYQCEPPLPTSYSYTHTQNEEDFSRPSTTGSRTLAQSQSHTRQTSAETATVTLFSTTSNDDTSMPSTPALSVRSSRSSSRSTVEAGASPPTPATMFTKEQIVTKTKARSPKRIPAPLVLCKEVGVEIEKPLATGQSGRSERTLRPPMSPNYGLLAGLEITEREGLRSSVGSRVSAVGVAF